MPYDEALAKRIRKALGRQPGLTEKEMFGGVGFLIRGNMACGVHGREMIVRVGPENHASALAEPHVRPFDLSAGRPAKGWILVEPAGLKTPAALNKWVGRGVTFARSLPAKSSKGGVR
jgi:TfoX/Sxy family transcriptional regulator of competence genes